MDDNGRPATRNVFAKITGMPIPDLGVLEMLKTGTLIGVCGMAFSVLSGTLAGKTGGKADDIKTELLANVFPGIQLVPSGVMAVGRAQEKGCTYCFAG